MLSLALATLVAVLPSGHGQVVNVGKCIPYPSTPAFDQQFIDKLVQEQPTYVMAITNGPKQICQKMHLFSNGTFVFSSVNRKGVVERVPGNYDAIPHGPGTKGTLFLKDFSFSAFGSVVTQLELVVLEADDNILLTLNCGEAGLLSADSIGGLIKEGKYTEEVAQYLQTKIKERQFRNSNRIIDQSKNCDGPLVSHQTTYASGLQLINQLGYVHHLTPVVNYHYPMFALIPSQSVPITPIIYSSPMGSYIRG